MADWAGRVKSIFFSRKTISIIFFPFVMTQPERLFFHFLWKNAFFTFAFWQAASFFVKLEQKKVKAAFQRGFV